MLTAIRGGLSFLTRLPVGQSQRDWDAFRQTPAAFPVVGYILGGLATAALVVPVPPAVAAFLFPVWLYLLTGINHVDGLADLGDALVVHGDAEKRRAVMRDTTVGVGAVLTTSLAVVGLALAGFAIRSRAVDSETVAGLLVGAEVGAKLGMAGLACTTTAAHDGMATSLTGVLKTRDLLVPALLALPAAVLTWPTPVAASALAGGLCVTVCVRYWAVENLGGVTGDVMGGTNEIARLVGLHTGVIVWTLW